MWNVELDLSQLDNAALESFLGLPNLPLKLWQAIQDRLPTAKLQ